MLRPVPRWRVARAVLLTLLVAPGAMFGSSPAGAAGARRGIETADGTIELTIGAGKLLQLPGRAASVFVADPSIADVQTPNPHGVFVFGNRPGRTTLFVLAPDGTAMVADTLDVTLDEAALRHAVHDGVAQPMHVEPAGNGLILSGNSPSPEAAAAAEDLARQTPNVGTVIDQLRVTSPIQVNLRVRVAEVSRSVSRELGFNWSTIFNAGSFHIGIATTPGNTGIAAGGANSLGLITTTGVASPAAGAAATTAGAATSAVDQIFGQVTSSVATGTLSLDAMADEGLVTLLAEPNLTTTSGEPATFLAGGEYPIPIPEGLGTVGIEYKQYGVSVGFTPTVLTSGMISMRISPEVSELSTTGSTTIDGINVPALISRRAQTTVELASGQSFAIAGLLQNNTANDLHKIPWLGDIPILGALFRSTSFQRSETELVIVVTAYTVRPTDTAPVLPTDLVRQTSDVERLFLNRALARAGSPGTLDPAAMPHLHGAAGFLFE